MPCYESPTRRFRIFLTFLDMGEGRRLVAADFADRHVGQVSREASAAASRAFADALLQHFGKPEDISKNPSFTAYVWRRPGGNPTQPDTIRTSVAAAFGANASLTSQWAYGEAKAPGDER